MARWKRKEERENDVVAWQRRGEVWREEGKAERGGVEQDCLL